MYTEYNFQSKKELKEAVANGVLVILFATRMREPKENGIEFVEGPHYPQAHRWYARVEMKDGRVVKVR